MTRGGNVSASALCDELRMILKLPKRTKNKDVFKKVGEFGQPPLTPEQQEMAESVSRLAKCRSTLDQSLQGLDDRIKARYEQLFATELQPATDQALQSPQLKTKAQLQKLEAKVEAFRKQDPALLLSADDKLTATRNAIAQLAPEQGELGTAATEALDWLDKTLNFTAVGGGAERCNALGNLTVGKVNAWAVGEATPKIVLTGNEQTRSLNKSTDALQKALSNPKSKEAELLKHDGGGEFAKGLFVTYGTLTAFGANHDGISPAEAVAINHYTGDDYAPINAFVRGEAALAEYEKKQGLTYSKKQKERLKFLAETCEEALQKLPKYPDVAWPVFRFERAWDEKMIYARYGKGKEFSCGVFWSTGARGMAVANVGSQSPHFNHVIFGKSGKDIAALSANTGEGATEQEGLKASWFSGRGEVLFSPKTKFKVVGRQDPDKHKVHYVEVTKNPVTVRTELREI